MMPTPKISVIICSYNRQDFIVQAIDSLYHQTIPRSDYEVVVVDNNSRDNTEAVVRGYMAAHPDLQIVFMNESEQGASWARNAGAKRAQSSLLAFMDDDAVAEKEFLERILSFFELHPDAAGLGGRIIPRYIPEEPKWMSRYVSSMVGNFDYSKEVKVFADGRYPLESNMVVRKEAFESINGFNTRLPGVKGNLRIGGEGKDFFYRLIARGKKIWYDPSVIVHHVVEVKKLTPDYLYRVASGYGRGEKVRMVEKGGLAYFKKVLEYIFKLGAAIVLGALYAIKGQPAKSWPVIKFRIDALRGLLEK
jgi:glycosyltransferase involved in cell wall biosynthesis